MKIQKVLESNPKPEGDFHHQSIADSYSRMLDHEVAEWELPYGYDVKPIEPEQYEEMESKFYYERK
jgi:hypothetical protein